MGGGSDWLVKDSAGTSGRSSGRALWPWPLWVLLLAWQHNSSYSEQVSRLEGHVQGPVPTGTL